MDTPIIVYLNDENPQWVETIYLNGTLTDYSSGYTFTVKLVDSAGTTAVTKTTNITGAASGVITVAWDTSELAALTAPTFTNRTVTYTAFLTPRKTADSTDGPTVQRTFVYVWRPWES